MIGMLEFKLSHANKAVPAYTFVMNEAMWVKL
jgi:hypothetical protein